MKRENKARVIELLNQIESNEAILCNLQYAKHVDIKNSFEVHVVRLSDVKADGSLFDGLSLEFIEKVKLALSCDINDKITELETL